MISLYLFYVLINFSTVTTSTNTANTLSLDVACNQLVEVMSDQSSGAMTYSNKYKIPVVDSNGKMMFNIGLKRNGSISRLSLMPAMKCQMNTQKPITITFTDETEFEVSQYQGIESHIDILIDGKLKSKMMTDNILSIAFDGKKYPYNVVLKPNQSRVVQDIFNCLQD